VPARATLAGTEMKRDERKANSVFQYYPVLEFTDAQGRAHRFTGEVSLKERDGGATERSGWDVGDTVQIRYDPRNPDDARMGGVWTWILPGFFIGMAALLLFSAHRMAEY
jgi:hypothetical protein